MWLHKPDWKDARRSSPTWARPPATGSAPSLVCRWAQNRGLRQRIEPWKSGDMKRERERERERETDRQTDRQKDKQEDRLTDSLSIFFFICCNFLWPLSSFFIPPIVKYTGQPGRALPLPCGTYQTEHICGRPLGMTFDRQVCDYTHI